LDYEVIGQPNAPANAGPASCFQSGVTGPAWLRSTFGNMRRSAKGWGALFAVLLFLTAAYVLTFGRCFLPLPNPNKFASEPMEFRKYSPFALPLQSQDFEGAYARIKWKFTRPGQARLFAASQHLSQAGLDSDSPFQKCFEELGYAFPKGCRASGGGDPPSWRITHYPSVLNRIERDLNLKPTYTERVGRDASSLPNPALQRTGASRSASEIDQQPVAAGSGR
jgi:hypothetical protein